MISPAGLRIKFGCKCCIHMSRLHLHSPAENRCCFSTSCCNPTFLFSPARNYTRGRRVFYMKVFCSLPLKPSRPMLSVSVSASLEAVICRHLGKSVLASHLSLSESWKFKKVACNIQEEKLLLCSSYAGCWRASFCGPLSLPREPLV